VRARVQHEDEGAGYFCKTASTGRGWRAVLCKMLSHLSLAFRFRSKVSDQSFHSLHKYPSFHLIWSRSNLLHLLELLSGSSHCSPGDQTLLVVRAAT
jgi:hypothetical protein